MSNKRKKIIEMIKRGATPGERAAAKEALNRYDAAHPDEADPVQYYQNGFSQKHKPEDYQPGVRMRWEHDRQAESANWQRQRDAEYKQTRQRAADAEERKRSAERRDARIRREWEYNRERQTRRDTEDATKRASQQTPPPKKDKYGYYEHIEGDTSQIGVERTSNADPMGGTSAGYVAPHETPTNPAAWAALTIALLVLLISALGGG